MATRKKSSLKRPVSKKPALEDYRKWGRMGGLATLKKYGKKQLIEWGKNNVRLFP